MWTMFFPMKKLRRNVKYVLLGTVVMLAALAAYLEFVSSTWERNLEFSSLTEFIYPTRSLLGKQMVVRYEGGPSVSHQWRPENKGKANLHIFEDWCGSSTHQLRKNLHYPLYPHVRTTVKKLAVSPGWTNYGLRVFGYLHPDVDGQYVFALASDDNSEFWLSLDENPINLQLLAYVGKTGKEWTAPGEFEKYTSQTSYPVILTAAKRYYFEVVHKQNNKGTDHVEVAWRLSTSSQKFKLIGSSHLSLYVDESGLDMSDIDHIPQTAASHVGLPKSQPHPAQMLREDPRDSFYRVPLIEDTYLKNVLPDCTYRPSYIIKGVRLLRYQGLQFVHLSYIYPNDNTRLTHMETENKCFYHNNAKYLERFGFNKYMKMDVLENPRNGFWNRAVEYPVEDAFMYGNPNWEDQDAFQDKFKKPQDYSDYAFNAKRRMLFSLDTTSETTRVMKEKSRRVFTNEEADQIYRGRSEQEPDEPTVWDIRKRLSEVQNSSVFQPLTKSVGSKLGASWVDHEFRPTVPTEWRRRVKDSLAAWSEREDQLNNQVPMPRGRSQPGHGDEQAEDGLETYEDPENYEMFNPAIYDPVVNWEQTFEVEPLDFHALRSDWIDLQCNVSGNLLLASTDALAVVAAFMKSFNQRNEGSFSLVRVVNVEKHADGHQAGRYLLDLELRERSGGVRRLSRYVYGLRRRSRKRSHAHGAMLLCNPLGFAWSTTATVHFIVPVKNQARWVQQFIVDMQQLQKATGDQNFNVIITDYNSTDMDVEQALSRSALPRYQYKRLSGNFERSAGLQAGINLITDDHSIVFLCDLHIHFPLSIIDNIRKHCVEGRMAFAPIVLRLDCGATPHEPDGFWEVNGFGLLGIYKSDLERAGGMNTKEFRDRWGGEDWELLDRILQAGLEVERIYLRNFMHHYHSKRGMWNRQPSRSL